MNSSAVHAGMNHVGLCVGDIDQAVSWYSSVFGLVLLDGPMHCDTTTAGAERRREVFGPRWGAMELAHMVTANGCGVELFEYTQPAAARRTDEFEYWWFGPNHIAFTVSGLEGCRDRLLAAGGRARTAVHDVHDGTLICYCEDPWGNVVEIVSREYAELSTATTKP